MRFFKPFVLAVSAAALCAPLTLQAFAASGPDKEWPCAQRKRLNLSLGALWSGPELSETDASWKKDEEVADLVKQLSKRRLSVEDAKKLIDEKAGKMDGDKAKRLSMVFEGLFQTLNLERRNIVHGIEKYVQKQIKLSEKIKNMALEADELGNKEELTDEEAKKLDEINEKLQWDTRIYDERNHSLEFVCESPVLLEQRLYALGQQIQANLK